jgi:tetratricopeptide (TPR) repeat protein
MSTAYLYFSGIVIFGFIGLLLRKLLDNKLLRSYNALAAIPTERNGEELIRGYYSTEVTVDVLEDQSATDTYNPAKNTFHLSADTARNRNALAIGRTVYLCALKYRLDNGLDNTALRPVLSIARLVSGLVFSILVIVALFINSVITLHVSLIFYFVSVLMLFFLNILPLVKVKGNISQLKKTLSGYVTENEFQALKQVLKSRLKYETAMLIFHPILVIYYYIYFLFQSRDDKSANTENVKGKSNHEVMSEEESESTSSSSGLQAYAKGINCYLDQQWDEALVHFDKALEEGAIRDDIDGRDFYSYRAECLQTLKYHYDAIVDFDKAIEISPKDCNLYFSRSISKGAILEYEGEINDLRKAIELSRENTRLNREYNDKAQKMGYSNAAHMFSSRMMIPESNLESEAQRQEMLNNAASDSERERLRKSFEEIKNLKLRLVKTRR